MGARLRRAYADAEDARAQLDAAGNGSLAHVGGPASADGYDEVQRLRLELGRAVERANSAETRASKLQADLAEARGGDAPSENGDGSDGSGEDEEKSLRFRLARTAASKKKSPTDGMWS